MTDDDEPESEFDSHIIGLICEPCFNGERFFLVCLAQMMGDCQGQFVNEVVKGT